MASTLFPKFLKDKSQYTEAERFWKGLFCQAKDQVPNPGDWSCPWFENPDKDGNPIFTAVCTDRRLGVRLLQFESTEADDIALDWWTDSFGDEENEVQELVISCAPTPMMVNEITRLLRQWIECGAIPVNK